MFKTTSAPLSDQIPGSTVKVKDEIMSDASAEEDTEEEETEEEAVQREIQELIVTAKDACRFIENDDRNGKIQCMCVSGDTCGTGQEIWRKVISDFFGRNKKNAQQIPEIYQVIWCRKHYQRGAYQRGRPAVAATSGKQSSLGKITWIVVQLLFIEKWRQNCRFTIALSEKEKKRLTTNNEANKTTPNKNPRGKGKTGRMNVRTERDAPIEVVRSYIKHLGNSKTTEECLRVVNEMKYDVEEDKTTYLPGLEFLAEVDENFEMPRKARHSQGPSKKEDPDDENDRDEDDDEGDGDEDGNRSGEDEDTTGDFGGTASDASMVEALEGNSEMYDSDDAGSQSTTSLTEHRMASTSGTKGHDRLNHKGRSMAGVNHEHSRLAKSHPAPSITWTPINQQEVHSNDSYISESEIEYNPDAGDYPPEDERNPIRKEVFRMIAAKEALAKLETSGSPSTVPGNPTLLGTPSLATPHATTRESSPSVEIVEETPQAVKDLLHLKRSGKPVDQAAQINSRSNATMAGPASDAPGHNHINLGRLSEVESCAVDSLVMLKNSVKLPSMPDLDNTYTGFGSDAFINLQIADPPKSWPIAAGARAFNLHAGRSTYGRPNYSPQANPRKRRSTLDGNENGSAATTAGSFHEGAPSERPLKRLRTPKSERSLFLE